MSKITTSTVYTVKISKDFYIEAMHGTCNKSGSFDFWLCRRDYGQKEYIYGIPVPSNITHEKSIVLIEEHMINFTDPDYMNVFCLSLLEDGETLENGSFRIKSYWDYN